MMLGPNEAHVWCHTFVPEGPVPPSWHALLSADEARAYARRRLTRSKNEYLRTRALLRTLLAHYTQRSADALSFVFEAHGRPELAPALRSPLRFNVSHTTGLIAIALTLAHDIGVDVEDTERRSRTLEIADRFFSAEEVAALRRRPPAEQGRAFFHYWTLKESYIKARGLGLALPLGKFSFVLDTPAPRIRCAPELNDNDDAWSFALYSPTARHQLALAVRTSGSPLRVHYKVAEESLVRP